MPSGLFLLGGICFFMGHARKGPKLLPEKLVKLREHLDLSHQQMARMLEREIELHDKKYPLKASRIFEYERGYSEPALIVSLAYSYVGEVSMMSLADDNVSVDQFCDELGTFQLGGRGSEKSSKKVSTRSIHGTR